MTDLAPLPLLHDRLARARAARSGGRSLNGAKPSAIAIDGMLEKARQCHSADDMAKIVKRLEDMPATFRKTYLLAVTGRSKAAAVRAFCGECCAWDRREVAQCTAPACPLFAFRPFTKRTRL